MFAMFSGRLARSQSGLGDLTSVASAFVHWLSLPVRRGVEPSLKLLESVPLTGQASLALVRFGAETLVLGVTAQSITVLAKGDSRADAKSAESEADTGTRCATDATQLNDTFECPESR